MALSETTLKDLMVSKLVDTGVSESDAEQWSNLFEAIAEAVVEHIQTAAQTTDSSGSTDGGGVK